MNLRTFDLNLLLAFDAVLRERSVLRAAKALGLSQPALSHALNRLRHLLKDQLFVRTPAGMTPTPRAEQLALPVRKALNDLQLALEAEIFSPATAERHFRIAVNNYAAVVLAAPIIAACRALAPRIRLSLRPSGTLDLADLLERGELDLVVSARDAPFERFAAQPLITDHYVAVLRRGHPALRRKLTLSVFAELPHLAISSSGEDISFVDTILAAHARSRIVALDVPYLSAGAALVQSNLVAVLGRQIAEEFRRAYPIEMRDLPFDAPRLRSNMMWHRRFDDQPAHRWLRDTIASTAAAI
ncbi:LysR family transcriptional regulator [Bradyrhizobium sp. U87765 SZCCT0131]|uniref:LysR family transcriptional regulator n=1 Tax=unclassified Bradyrhizobium TaxID=2631580 RepID=UPI001BA7D11A|nr:MULTISPECIES: LysR family transcriptional regulator [unclassified Bradyrhizobium]MBR1222450.1 LysR family transcriptional regulator [Bradyrhizobium sp. U87765 SZCCT0131]MBR1264066.1 LysR family transcriptional regulator [Bradyrhizobium sp. U87765 SZCCT0134]MBR1308151.1 LysR family transcriptional regulator [Bradyrhizobium sp. U87765 SZCCT0110]MBR1320316.1 LysR family transcriptional regulator [Bradyrhizobium sp. U87765 SZCCT0109]MBR1348571.1 LysR family transcriptional regulator [Bradyrhizo